MVSVIALFTGLVKAVPADLDQAIRPAPIRVIFIDIVAFLTNARSDDSVSTNRNGTECCTRIRCFALIAFLEGGVYSTISTNRFRFFLATDDEKRTAKKG